MPSRRESDAVPSRSRTSGALALFLLFSGLGLSTFGGGVSAWMHRAFVERRRALTEREFGAAMALARILPGANVVNLAVVVGHRVGGGAGALAAVLGLLVGPGLCVVALAMVYDRVAGSTIVHAALEGAAAAAVGLVLATAIKSGRALVAGRKSARDGAAKVAAAAIAAGTFGTVAILRLPTVPVVLCLTPLSIAFAYAAWRRSAGGADDGA
jgi:chromate transporter